MYLSIFNIEEIILNNFIWNYLENFRGNLHLQSLRSF